MVVLVTGAASVNEWTIGIGTACAFAFGRDGAEVVIADIDDTYGQQIAAQICAKPEGRARFVHHDVTSEAGWRDILGDIVHRHDWLDVLRAPNLQQLAGHFKRLLPS
ncbi:SDR family NAD(P)-dependent oxidoreductase [Bradyrhizobium sp. 170]|nr:SDR family NAD(P)-dependent oxidoreductase [Bradyrhizobium sp. 170]